MAIFLSKFVDPMISAFQSIPEDKLCAHIKAVRESGEYNNLARRILWDCARAVRYWNIVDDPTALDDHYYTLFKQAFQKAFPGIYKELLNSSKSELQEAA